MKLLLDTADFDDLRDGMEWGIFSGITVNPIIAERAGMDYLATVREILDFVPEDWDISFQVMTEDPASMVKQARVLSGMDNYGRVRIKISTTEEGLKAASQLVDDTKLNMTIVKTPAQTAECVALAQNAFNPDMYISLFCYRLRVFDIDWRVVMEECRQIIPQDIGVKLLAASIKTPRDITESNILGADVLTAPLEVYKLRKELLEEVALFNEPFERGLSVPS